MDCEVLYWGYSQANGAGHGIYRPDGFRITSAESEKLPGLLRESGIDQTFVVKNPTQPEGIATFQHFMGWTVIAFWDRSGDGRLGSNSAFLIKGAFPLSKEGYLAAYELAYHAFPGVFQRLAEHGISTLNCVFNSLPL